MADNKPLSSRYTDFLQYVAALVMYFITSTTANKENWHSGCSISTTHVR